MSAMPVCSNPECQGMTATCEHIKGWDDDLMTAILDPNVVITLSFGAAPQQPPTEEVRP